MLTIRRFYAACCTLWLMTPLAHAGLTFYTSGDLMMVHGTAENGDARKLKGKLTPDIKTVVLRSPRGMDWTTARDLGDTIAAANISTVLHGWCAELACPVMFLAGKNRMFSGVGRAEAHYLSLYIGNGGFVFSGTQDRVQSAMDWWLRHTKLTMRDVEVYRESVFSILPNSEKLDRKVFFPDAAHYPKGNILHCSGGAKSAALIDCMPVPDSSALGKGIVTTATLFTDPRLTEKEDTPAPAPTAFAALTDISAVPVGDNCKGIYADFLKQPSPRAFYVSEQRGCGWNNQQAFRPNKAAMDRCNESKQGECRLYAVDDHVVFVPFSEALPAQAPQSAQRGALPAAPLVSVLLARSASKEEGPVGVADKFGVEGKILAYVTLRPDGARAKDEETTFETRWFCNDKLVMTQTQSVLLSPAPTSAWQPILAADIGVGRASVEIYVAGKRMASKTFSIVEKL